MLALWSLVSCRIQNSTRPTYLSARQSTGFREVFGALDTPIALSATSPVGQSYTNRINCYRYWCLAYRFLCAYPHTRSCAAANTTPHQWARRIFLSCRALVLFIQTYSLFSRLLSYLENTMEAVSSPMKRRAVLGSLDANAALSTTPIASKMIMMGSSMLLTPSALLVSSPLIGSQSSKGKKRTAGEDDEGVVDESPVPKKTCVDGVSRLSFCLLCLDVSYILAVLRLCYST